MGVLATIFAQSRRIAANIARVLSQLIEGRAKEQRQRLIVADQVFLQGLHRRHGTGGIGNTRQDGPGLGDRVYLALRAIF
ncbi:hypothetical protein D3C77_721790 [compost metagenome]